jgi:hypothetical protein
MVKKKKESLLHGIWITNELSALRKQPQGFRRLIATPGTKRRRPQLTANWNSDNRCAACVKQSGPSLGPCSRPFKSESFYISRNKIKLRASQEAFASCEVRSCAEDQSAVRSASHKVAGPVLFAESTTTVNMYRQMDSFSFPQMEGISWRPQLYK